MVTTHPKPHFDANVTNHVTVLNFNVNLECLQAQMLGLVVLNERKDLDDTYNENSKEAFESIKSLKDVEKAILSQLEASVDELRIRVKIGRSQHRVGRDASFTQGL